MQKVPLGFATAMQSKRLQNYNRYQIIYSIDVILPRQDIVSPKTMFQKKVFYKHLKIEPNRLFPAHGNKTPYLLPLQPLLHFRGPYRRTEIV